MNNNTNQSHVDNRFDQFLRQRVRADQQQAFLEFKNAIEAGYITLPNASQQQPVYAGGMNYCPNSDLKYSKMAHDVGGTTPSTAGDTNHECDRFFRQTQGSNISTLAANALKGSSHSLYAANEGANAQIPIWDRTNGFLHFGDTSHAFDVAINLYNNDIKPAEKWFVRFSLGALTTDLVPSDLQMYVGFWEKTSSGEGWIKGGLFDLEYDIIGVKGTKNLQYLVVATTDSGVELYSQVLNITNAPNGFDTEDDISTNKENFPRIKYSSQSGSGFTRFKIYRKDVASGKIYQIADILNTNTLLFDDFGGFNNMVAVQAFPTSANVNETAYAQSQRLVVGAYGQSLVVNSFTIQVPSAYNWSNTLAKSQFLRFGFLGNTAVNRQIRLDKIWCGLTYNDWSDSPLDNLSAIPSTSQSVGVGSGNGGVIIPPHGGSGTCILTDTKILRKNFDNELEWLEYKNVPIGDVLEIGKEKPNLVREKHLGEEKEYLVMLFANGCQISCTLRHGFFTNEAKTAQKQAQNLNEGEKVLGYKDGKLEMTELISRIKVIEKNKVEVGTFSTTGDSSYICGNGIAGVVCPNLKPGDGIEISNQ